MKKTLKYVFLLQAFLLVVFTSGNLLSDAGMKNVFTEQSNSSKVSAQSFEGFDFFEDVLDDEQVSQTFPKNFIAEKVDFIKIWQNKNLFLQPCLVPWQPPKA